MPNAQDEKIVRDYLSRHLPCANGDVLAFKVCIYVHGDPRLGPLPGHPRVTVIAACNGGGFKFSSAYGEALADFATTGRTEPPVDFMAFPN
jgi:glycine/D-amino acid oxidase-like deaminating enzyme